MKKITKILFLNACLSITISSVFAMKEDDDRFKVKVINDSTYRIEKAKIKTDHFAFVRQNWLPILGFTTLTAYSIYDRQIRLETLAWSKNILQSLPKLVIGLIGTGVLCRAYTYLFNKQPLCNNPEHNKYVTLEMFTPYQKFLNKLMETQEVQQELQQDIMSMMHNPQIGLLLDSNPELQELLITNPQEAVKKIKELLQSDSGLPSQSELGDLFNSSKENKTKKADNQTPPIDPLD
jgi:hypothetical protein